MNKMNVSVLFFAFSFLPLITHAMEKEIIPHSNRIDNNRGEEDDERRSRFTQGFVCPYDAPDRTEKIVFFIADVMEKTPDIKRHVKLPYDVIKRKVQNIVNSFRYNEEERSYFDSGLGSPYSSPDLLDKFIVKMLKMLDQLSTGVGHVKNAYPNISRAFVKTGKKPKKRKLGQNLYRAKL